MSQSNHIQLLLFDIDGTLIRIKNDIIRRVITDTLITCGVEVPSINRERFAGRTDRDIFLSLPGVTPEIFSSLCRQYEILIEDRLSSDDIEVLPGVHAALSYFQQRGFSLGLITGNCKKAAYCKLRKAGLAHFFQTGAFGDDHEDRNHLPALARKESGEYFRRQFTPDQTVIIGDTPHDIRCAQFDKSRIIAVSTGTYSYSELQLYEPDLLLASLENPESWFDAFQ